MPAVDDLKSLDRLDQAVLGAGALAIILSLFPFLTVKLSGIGVGGNAHENAWHGWGLLAVLCIIVATALAFMRLFRAAAMPSLPVGVNLLTLLLSGAAFLFLLIHWLANRRSSGPAGFRVTEGMALSGWLLLLAVLAQAAAAFLLFKKSGEAVPDFQAMAASRSAGAKTATTAPMPMPPPPVRQSTPPPPPSVPYSQPSAVPYSPPSAVPYPPPPSSGGLSGGDTPPPTSR